MPVLQKNGSDEFDQSRLPGLPKSRYQGIDFKVVAQYPNQIIAVYDDGSGIIFNQETGQPIHGVTEADLAAQIGPNIAWHFVRGPHRPDRRVG